MKNIYKVTSASVGETKRGYKIFKFHLDNSIWATRLFPLRKLDQKYDALYQRYLKDENISFLNGRFISVSLNQSEYGYEIYSIDSFDAIQTFKALLDGCKGKAFSTNMNMYEFLKSRKYPVNEDSSITLKPPYDGFNLTDRNLCYPNNLKDDCLTLKNIEIVFNQFYRNKIIERRSLDIHEKYVLTPVAIVRNCKIDHKDNGKTLSNTNHDVLRIGDSLSKEQYEFICGNSNLI